MWTFDQSGFTTATPMTCTDAKKQMKIQLAWKGDIGVMDDSVNTEQLLGWALYPKLPKTIGGRCHFTLTARSG